MKIRTPAVCLSLTLCTCAAVPERALAQIAAPAKTAEMPPHRAPTPVRSAVSVGDLVEDVVEDFTRLPSRDTMVLLGVGAATAFTVHRLDRRTSSWISSERALNGPFEPGNVIGGFEVQLGGALATYTIGRLTRNARVTAVGADLVRAHVVSQTVTGAVKFSARRTRPDGTHLSFPSGHTSASFASATVLQRHFGWKVGVPAMGVASYVAAARIQEKRHFLSDVAFGAAIGLAAGRTVTIGRGERRFALAPMATPRGAGVSLTWVGR